MTETEPPKAAAPAIAIIGLKGSGKTVLVTTLAKRLSTIDARGVFLNPQGVKTLRYIEDAWQRLQSGDWPPGTPEGDGFELRWKFQIVGELECDVRLVDPSGQDLWLLFGEERILDTEQVPAPLRALADYCRSARVVLFLLNLKDFLGEGDPSRRAANEAALKSAMDHLNADGGTRRVCLVFTQVDLYREAAREAGGWIDLAARQVPYVFGAHLHPGRVDVGDADKESALAGTPAVPGAPGAPGEGHALPHRAPVAVHAVAAVSQTKPGLNEQGKPQRFPVPGFQSEGLDELVDWLTAQLREISREQPTETERRDDAPGTSVARSETTDSTTTSAKPMTEEDKKALAVVGVILAVILMLAVYGGYALFGGGKTSPTPPSRPVPSGTFTPTDVPGLLDDWIVVNGTVSNGGAAGKIRIRVKVTENDRVVESGYDDVMLAPGQTHNFRYELKNIYSVKNPHKTEVWFEVP